MAAHDRQRSAEAARGGKTPDSRLRPGQGRGLKPTHGIHAASSAAKLQSDHRSVRSRRLGADLLPACEVLDQRCPTGTPRSDLITVYIGHIYGHIYQL